MMRSSAMASLAALFFAIYTAPVVQGQSNCERSDLDEFESMHSPAEGFLIYWNHPTDNISFRVEVVSEEWAAIGFSTDGDMVGSDAVIFLPQEDDVSEHILGSQSVSDILPSDVTELTDTAFQQEGGDTIFWFTRNTTPKDLTTEKLIIPNIPNQPIYIIWAKGMDNGFGYHGQMNRGSFLVDLFCTDLETPASTPAAIVATDAPVTAESPPSFTLPPGGVAETAPPGTPADPPAEPVAPPTAEPAAAPTAEPVAAPTAEPAAAPTAEPVAAPTAEPVAAPTAEPVAAPTAEPVAAPTAEPVAATTEEPVAAPTDEPGAAPASRSLPTAEPTAPVAAPTAEDAAPVTEPATTSMPIAAPVVEEASPTAETPPTAGGAEETTMPAAAPAAAPTADGETTRSPVESPSTGDADELTPTAGEGTLTPSAGSRDIDEGAEGTSQPSPSATGYTGGATSLGGGADGAAVTSAVVAACVAMIWARWN